MTTITTTSSSFGGRSRAPPTSRSLRALVQVGSLILLLSTVPSPSASASAAGDKKSLSELDYELYPMRETHEAAVVEWGHSAVISALDAAVATFGPQTSRGAFFEVEAAPVLADPIDGVGKKFKAESRKPDKDKATSDEDGGNEVDEQKENEGEIGDEEEALIDVPPDYKLSNADLVDGNMVVMTNAANLSGVQMARIAVNSGAAALMVVNTDQDHPDFIYSLSPETDEEAEWADKNVDIPIIMVSRTSGNVLTTATVTEGMTEREMRALPNNGMPERVRLYAGGDRPFFEDVTAAEPTIYLIHNMLTDEECNNLIASAQGKLELVDDTESNILENSVSASDGRVRAVGVERIMLWKGQLHSHLGKAVEERIDQVTGYPADHFSDWQINKYTEGSFHAPHYDVLPTQIPIATITVFLNDVEVGNGGEVVFPNVEGGNHPVKIQPRKGMAIVHHNTDEDYRFDPSTLHAELELTSGVKYVAKKFVYAVPQPPSRRIVLPLLSIATGGKLPRFIVNIHDILLDKFGLEQGTTYFDKLMVMMPVLVLLGIASVISSTVKDKMTTTAKASKSASAAGGGSSKAGGKSGSKGGDATSKQAKTKTKKRSSKAQKSD